MQSACIWSHWAGPGIVVQQHIWGIIVERKNSKYKWLVGGNEHWKGTGKMSKMVTATKCVFRKKKWEKEKKEWKSREEREKARTQARKLNKKEKKRKKMAQKINLTFKVMPTIFQCSWALTFHPSTLAFRFSHSSIPCSLIPCIYYTRQKIKFCQYTAIFLSCHSLASSFNFAHFFTISQVWFLQHHTDRHPSRPTACWCHGHPIPRTLITLLYC